MSDPPKEPVSQATKRDEVEAVLRRGRRRGWRSGVVLVLLLSAAAVGVYLVWGRGPAEPHALQFQTVQLVRGTIDETVTATGTLSPVDSVELGAEVTGKLTKVSVDVNDQVEAGQVLAEIDPEQLGARVQEARAGLQSALANHKSAKSSLAEAQLKEQRLKALFERGLSSAEELETLQATTARAEASLAAAAAQITVARASLASAETALSRASIVAPISGVVLARAVEPGQTVTAGFQTPVLFTLARDLSQLELRVEVDEADIGKVHEGQTATFTVDAYPERRFESKLVKLHNLPTTVEGTNTVVTYAAVLTVQNTDRLLRPGMTATATIITRSLKDALLVPNAALRFEPPTFGAGSKGPGFFRFLGFGRRGGPPKRPPGGVPVKAIDPNADRIYVRVGTDPKRVVVNVIGTDGVRSALEPVHDAVPREGTRSGMQRSDIPRDAVSLDVGAEVIVDVVGETGT